MFKRTTFALFILAFSSSCSNDHKSSSGPQMHHGEHGAAGTGDRADGSDGGDGGGTVESPFEGFKMTNPDLGLMLVDPLIVQSDAAKPGGPWSFGALMLGMLPEGAGRKEVSNLAKNWLVQWASNRQGVQDEILCPWLKASNPGAAGDCPDGQLDMNLAPFHMMAIVNRMDLQQEDQCGDAGELRLAFALDGKTVDKPVNVIFEYAVPTTSVNVGQWASRWVNASDLSCNGSEDCQRYLAIIQMMTDEVTHLAPTTTRRVTDDVATDEAPVPDVAFKEFLPRSLFSNLRHIRVHDQRFGKTQFREFDWKNQADGPHLFLTMVAAAGVQDPASETKCVSCHTTASSDPKAPGERFNLKSTYGSAAALLAPEIGNQLPARLDRVNLLQQSKCNNPNGQQNAQRQVPW